MRLPPEEPVSTESEEHRKVTSALSPAFLVEPEPLSKIFRRIAARWSHPMTPPRVEEINTIRLPRTRQGLLIFARRNVFGFWNVYSSIPDAYNDTVTVEKTNLTLKGVYDAMAEMNPGGMAADTGCNRHPEILRARYPLLFNGK